MFRERSGSGNYLIIKTYSNKIIIVHLNLKSVFFNNLIINHITIFRVKVAGGRMSTPCNLHLAH